MNTPRHPDCLICFDWDGTISDSMRLCIVECREALRIMGLPDLPDETLMKCNGPTNWDGCEILGVPEAMKPEFVRVRAQAGLDNVEKVCHLFPGARDMILRLKELAPLAIVSNGQGEYIRRSLTIFGLEGCFDHIRAYTEGMTKADLLQNLLDEVRPARAIMIGDRLGDLNAGKACRLPTVAACYGYGNDAEYAVADIRCDTVESLKEYLTHWCENN